MSENKNEVVTKVEDIKTIDMYNDVKSFESAWRIANALAKSNMIPQEFQKKPENCMIALDMCSRLGMSPFMIMQNIYIVYGKPSFSSKFMIALINNSKRFKSGLKFKIEGKGDNLSCYAYATYPEESESVKGTKVTIVMAKAEGWYDKKGSKWKTMPEKMIKYRAASFFANEFCPDLIFGISSKEEIEDIEPRTVESVVETEVENKQASEILDIEIEEKKEEKIEVKKETVETTKENKKEDKGCPFEN